MNYLVVVDMQNDFIDGPLGTPEAQAIVPKVADKIKKWSGPILFTLDSHGRNYKDTQEGQLLPVEHCQLITHGWLLNEDVRNSLQDRPDEFERASIIEKKTFGSVDLVNKLVNRYNSNITKVSSITLVGLCTDICVVSNALLLKAAMPEVPIYVDPTCCAGTTPENHEAALKVMQQCQVIMVADATL